VSEVSVPGAVVETVDGSRPRYLGDESTIAALDRIAEHEGPITLIVGAGASMEAGLPSWPELIGRLLNTVAEEQFEPAVRQDWIEVIREESLTAAAAVVHALTGDDETFVERVREALYGDNPTTVYQPQALAQQVAWMKRELGGAVKIATGNYDGLIEAALDAEGLTVHSYIQGREEPAGSAAVYHLHGRLIPSYPRTGRIVLGDADYARVQQERSWQDTFMRDALDRTLCVFVGASLTDPNLIRWLYRYSTPPAARRHLAIFVRQASPDLRPPVRAAVETATRARWAEVGVDAVFADFFGEIAQLLHEAVLRRGGALEEPFHDRAQERFQRARQVFAPDEAEQLRPAQDRASAYLRQLLKGVRAIAAAGDVDLSGETLGLALWGVDHENGRVGVWAMSDRRFSEPQAVIYNNFEYRSDWVAIEAVTRGVPVEADPRVYASRWRLIRGVPIVVPAAGGPGRTISGVLTLTSMTPQAQSRLPRSREVSTQVDTFLAGAGAALFE
jgi:NAD-dependent SIR2 family protein deacetylase